jgi:hypothetical protein
MKNNLRKKGISVRMDTNDLEKLKHISSSLSVRDSDVIRFAIKSMLKRLAPLTREENSARDLLPVFIEYGAELTRAFDLGADEIESIINTDNKDSTRIDREDIELLSISGSTESYQQLRIHKALDSDGEARDVNVLLREYLYRKYLSETRPVSGNDAEMKLASI